MSKINDTLSITNGGFVSKEQMEEMTRRQILRDHFAGLAMQGLIQFIGDKYNLADLSQDAYKTADAMLKEREKKE